MNKGNRVYAIGLVAGLLAITGCASNSERSTSENYSVQGCLAGGLGAGALAYLVNIGDAEQEEKTAIAMAVGCMGGAIVGYEVAKRTEQYADAQQAAQAETARNNQHVAQLRQVNQRLEENIADYNQQIAKIESSTFNAKEKQKQKLKIKEYVGKQLNQSQASLAVVEQELSDSYLEYQNFEAVAQQQERDLWLEQIESLESEKDILSGHVTTLNALDSSI